MENFIFCAVTYIINLNVTVEILIKNVLLFKHLADTYNINI